MQSGERTEPVENTGGSNNGNSSSGSNNNVARALNLNSPSYNTRNPAVRRLLHEARELENANSDQFWARPLEDNLFEWHFTIAGPSGCEFEGGLYHGRIILPANYPLQPPSFILTTQNGRFETNRKICLSISGHHPESWQPSWSIRTALVALIAFLPTPGAGAIGSLDYPVDERKRLAAKSRSFCCPDCGPISSHLAKPTATTDNTEKSSEQQQQPTNETTNVPSENAKEEITEQKTEAAGQPELPQQPVTAEERAAPSFPSQFPISFPFPVGQATPDAAADFGAGMMAGMPPPPYVAAAYLPYLYQSMYNYASYYAHQAAITAVIAGATQQRLAAGVEPPQRHHQPQQQQQGQQNLAPVDLIAQQQHRERRASALLFAIILVAWTITRFLDRFIV